MSFRHWTTGCTRQWSLKGGKKNWGEPYNPPVSIVCRISRLQSMKQETQHGLVVSLGWENPLRIQGGQSSWHSQGWRWENRERSRKGLWRYAQGSPCVCSNVRIRTCTSGVTKAEGKTILESFHRARSRSCSQPGWKTYRYSGHQGEYSAVRTD